jgi:hypothetical protein
MAGQTTKRIVFVGLCAIMIISCLCGGYLAPINAHADESGANPFPPEDDPILDNDSTGADSLDARGGESSSGGSSLIDAFVELVGGIL